MVCVFASTIDEANGPSEISSAWILLTCQDSSRRPKIADSSSRNALSFSSACTTKRFPSSRCASATKMVRLQAKADQIGQQTQRLDDVVSAFRRLQGWFRPKILSGRSGFRIRLSSPFGGPPGFHRGCQVGHDVLARDSVFSSLSWPMASSLGRFAPQQHGQRTSGRLSTPLLPPQPPSSVLARASFCEPFSQTLFKSPNPLS